MSDNNDHIKVEQEINKSLDEVQRQLFLTRYQRMLENWFRIHPKVPPPVYRDKEGNYYWVTKQQRIDQ